MSTTQTQTLPPRQTNVTHIVQQPTLEFTRPEPPTFKSKEEELDHNVCTYRTSASLLRNILIYVCSARSLSFSV